MKRPAALALALALGAAGVVAAVQAQTAAYPSRPIRLVVPFAPGGPADSIGRQVGGALGAAFGQPVVVDNRAGAGGAIGADLVAKAAPDGHTLLLSNVGDTIAVSLYKNLPYDYQRQFTPVSLVASSPFVIVVHPGVPAGNVTELIQLAKAKPGTLTFGSAGIGVASHLAGELFKQMAGVSITHVPYKGQAPATADLLGGQIAFMFNNPLTSLPHVQSGKLRAIGVTSKARLAAAPNIPTVAETGVPGFDVGTWFAVVAPAGTPAPIVNRVAAEIAKAMADRDTRDKLAAQGVEAIGSTPAELGRLIQADVAKWAKVIKDGGIAAE
jgi:tripartite-type tricarboxylate transporter receptor subunit TctC